MMDCKITIVLEAEIKGDGRDGNKQLAEGKKISGRSYLADFASMKDFKKFLEYSRRRGDGYNNHWTELSKITIPSFGVKNLYHKNRLLNNTYFDIDFDKIQDSMVFTTPEEGIGFSFFLDFQGYREDGSLGEIMTKNNDPFLDTIDGDLQAYGNIDGRLDEINFNNLSVRVNNVGQGNWNEIKDGDTVKLVYDIGASLSCSLGRVHTLAQSILQSGSYKEKMPLVLSHWDKDHYFGLLALQNCEIVNVFSRFLFPVRENDRSLPCVSAGMVYEKMKNCLGKKNLIPVTIADKKRGGAAVPGQVLDSVGLMVFKGQFLKSDRNLSCLQIAVYDREKIIVLTGDARWFQLSHVLNKYVFSKLKSYLNYRISIVVPHHGSGADETYLGHVLPHGTNYGIAAVSVDAKNNRYGHPARKVMRYLSSLGYSVQRTDINGPINIC